MSFTSKRSSVLHLAGSQNHYRLIEYFLEQFDPEFLKSEDFKVWINTTNDSGKSARDQAAYARLCNNLIYRWFDPFRPPTHLSLI